MLRAFLISLLVLPLAAHEVRIVRDDWGIAHIYGKTDADTVFGAVYAQAEDDFNRIEMNYLTNLGRVAEAEGETAVMHDAQLQKEYAASPQKLRSLMDAFAEGLNFYLAKHRETHPRVIRHFEPWMALCFTEGSIGGDVERIKLPDLQAFYDKSATHPVTGSLLREEGEPSGSNGIAIGRAKSLNGHSLLLINPHTSFFFRSELQMVSEEGLNAYGAVTWGQFFVYQGFNNRVGWMHTSSGVDAVDEWAETVTKKGEGYVYRYGSEERPVTSSSLTIRFKTPTGMGQKAFTVYRTHHGPIVREADGKWISFRMMEEPIKALEQSFYRTKAQDYKSYLQTMQLQANSSNNTIFADADGEIAYFHGNYIPRRDTRFDWTKPVDGSNPAAEWKGLLAVSEAPHLFNPPSGWLFNVNNWPWSAAGPGSLKREDYPVYVESGTESARGRHALRLLDNSQKLSLDTLLTAAYDSYLPWFASTIPALIKAWDQLPSGNNGKTQLSEQISVLRGWDMRWSTSSIPTSLAVFWGEQMSKQLRAQARQSDMLVEDYVTEKTSPDALLQGLQIASDRLTADFGTWKKPWGEINRFQRINGAIAQPFNDALPSIPVGFTSSVWGSLASFGSHAYPQTKKWYGTSGNSFVAVVEFGDKVRARAVTAGGESGHPDSKHFNDEASRYTAGNLRPVYFYPEDLKGHTEREYRVRTQ